MARIISSRSAILAWAALSLAACKPPASDEYLKRVDLTQAGSFASEPLPSPETEGAIWAESDRTGRILYGIPGSTPLLALACESSGKEPLLQLTRFAPADPRAKALMALVGNGHVARIPVDAAWNGSAWLWQGSREARGDTWEVLTGPRSVEATLPGAGTVTLNPSQRPSQLIAQCRGNALPE